MEASHCRLTTRLIFVIHESAVAFRYQEHTLNVVGGISREMIFQVDYVGSWRKISYPESMA
jgi:hypothetical protein